MAVERQLKEGAGDEATTEEDGDAGEGEMDEEEDVGEGAMEEDDDPGEGVVQDDDPGEVVLGGDMGDNDFYPFFLVQRPPSADRASGESSTQLGGAEEDVDTKRQDGDGNFETEAGAQQQMLSVSGETEDGGQQVPSGSEEFVGELEGDDKFFELGTDYEEDDELDDMEQEEKDREYLEGCLNGMDYREDCCVDDENGSLYQNLDGLGLKGCIGFGRNPLCGTQDKINEDYIASEMVQLGELVRIDVSEGRKGEQMDRMWRRKRSRYSLADMSLDQLETFLQGSDEEDDPETMEDREEYEKFLRAVLEKADKSKEPELSGRREDEDDEDDVDFEIEIEEALESDDVSESVRTRKGKALETREKRRRRVQVKSRGPLRQLRPHLGNFVKDVSKRNMMTEGIITFCPTNGKITAPPPPVSGFTAHQIGQLHCLMHEHVQLLVQVYSLCAWDPAREKLARETHGLLLALAKERESVLSWKKTAFPDFCFRPPYTHPSAVEGGEQKSLLHYLSPPDHTHTSSSYGQSALVPSNTIVFPSSGQVYLLPKVLESFHHSAQDLEAFSPVAKLTQAFSSAQHHTPAAEHCSQLSTVTSQPRQAGAHPVGGAPGISSLDQSQQAALSTSDGGVSSTVNVTPLSGGSSYSATTGPSGMVDRVGFEWAPIVSGPVRSLLDVAPLALVPDFLRAMARVLQEYRQLQVKVGATIYDRQPLFLMAAVVDQDQNIGRNVNEGTRSRLSGNIELILAPPQIKKTMAAALVESTKKKSISPVPKGVAAAVQRFVPYFNKSMFPHKPPPIATSNRLFFTEAEDELLAMGMMHLNHDWGKIQKQYLPCKTEDQVRIRAKNRMSAKAFPNSIKAVDQFKKSPLTESEKVAIQEAMNYLKHDWKQIWLHCVPYRDPNTIKRQWRTAIGTQKSYKTSETSKERRRVYEASRRQKLAALKSSSSGASTAAEGSPPSGSRKVAESSVATKNNSSDDAEDTQIQESLTEIRSLRSPPVVAPGLNVARTERQQRKLLLSKKRKPRFQTGNMSRPRVDSQASKGTSNRKQTVQLAPGLPCVKLPSHVQVLSQSEVQPQQPLPAAKRVVPATYQWSQRASQGRDKSELSIPTLTVQPLSLPNCAIEATTAQAIPALHQFAVPSSRRSGRRGQISLKKKSTSVQVSPTQGNAPIFLRPNGDSAMPKKLSFQKPCLSGSLPPLLHAHSQNGRYCGESAGSAILPIQRLDSLHAQRRNEMSDRISTNHMAPNYQDESASYARALSTPMDSSQFCVSQPSTAVATSGGICVGNELQFYGPQYPIQGPPRLVGPTPLMHHQMKKKGKVTSEAMSSVSHPPIDFTQMPDGKRSSRGSAKERKSKPRRDPIQRKRKAIREKILEIKGATQGTSTSPPTLKESLHYRTFFGVEDISDPCTSSGHVRSGSTVRYRNRKDRKQHDPFFEEGSQEPLADQHIVMEKEELSDSEDEADAGVEFEHEEMGDDSDKEIDVDGQMKFNLGYVNVGVVVGL